MSNDDFTPSTASIRIAYVYVDDANASVQAERGAAFDRWLAAHDAEVERRSRFQPQNPETD